MRISEVSKLFDLSADTIRYYEKIGLLEPISKDFRGRKDYQEADLRRLRFVKTMRKAGVSTERIKTYVCLFKKGEETLQVRKKILIQQRDEMEEKLHNMHIVFDELNYTIDHFDETFAKWERMKRHPEEFTEEELMTAEKERSIYFLEISDYH